MGPDGAWVSARTASRLQDSDIVPAGPGGTLLAQSVEPAFDRHHSWVARRDTTDI